jgi:hypothetical protein
VWCNSAGTNREPYHFEQSEKLYFVVPRSIAMMDGDNLSPDDWDEMIREMDADIQRELDHLCAQGTPRHAEELDEEHRALGQNEDYTITDLDGEPLVGTPLTEEERARFEERIAPFRDNPHYRGDTIPSSMVPPGWEPPTLLPNWVDTRFLSPDHVEVDIGMGLPVPDPNAQEIQAHVSMGLLHPACQLPWLVHYFREQHFLTLTRTYVEGMETWGVGYDGVPPDHEDIPARTPPPLDTGCAACFRYTYPAYLQGWVKKHVCSHCPPHVHEGVGEHRL